MTTAEAISLLQDGPFLLSGGIQTTLVFKHDIQLRQFASFEALFDPDKEATLQQIYRSFADVAVEQGLPLIILTETWRTSANWYKILGTSADHRARVHKLALDHAQRVKAYMHEKSGGKLKSILLGVVGPMKDAYTADSKLSVEEAREYHRTQIQELKELRIGVVCAYTLTTSTEGVAIAAEAKDAGLPCMISFTVDTHGRMPSGESLQEAVERVDAETDHSVLFFQVNCSHPLYIRKAVEDGGAWIKRVRGVLGNASVKSHEELDECTELDAGYPEEFAKELVALGDVLPDLVVMGGCCGTDSVHCREIAKILKA